VEALGISADNTRLLFRLMDMDGSGKIDLSEFCEGCLRLQGEAKSVDVHAVLYQVKQFLLKWSEFTGFVEDQLDHMEDGLYPPERDLDVFNRLYKNVNKQYSAADIMATSQAGQLFKEVGDMNRGMTTQDMVNAKGAAERKAILDKRTEQLKAELRKQKGTMMSADYAAAEAAIDTAHATMAAVINDADGWSQQETDALAGAEKNLFASGGALENSAFKVVHEAADAAANDQSKQGHLLKDLVGYQGDVGLTHVEEAKEAATEHQEANADFSEQVAAVSEAMKLIEGDLKPAIDKHIADLNARWTAGMEGWAERDKTLFAPEERQLTSLKERIQDELRTMENALAPMEARYRAYGDLVANKKAEATEQETALKQKLKEENDAFSADAIMVSTEAENRVKTVADKIGGIVNSLVNVTDAAQETVDDADDRALHIGDTEARVMNLKFNGEVDELKNIVGDVQQVDADHYALSKWAQGHDATSAAWRKIVEDKLESMGLDVSKMQGVITADSSLASRQLRRAGQHMEDQARAAMTEEQKRMDQSIRQQYEHTDLLIAKLEADQSLSAADRAKAIAELKGDRTNRIRDIMMRAEQVKSAERAADAEAQRYKQSVANVVDSLHAKTAGMGGSAGETNQTATAVAAAAEHVHKLSLSPALAPSSLMEDSAEDSSAKLEEANSELAAEDMELKAELTKLRGKLQK